MKKEAFQKTILAWYRKSGRHDLVWRKTKNPYHILVSEIMLQQTQVSRVVPFYKAFLKKFPTTRALARASSHEVLKAWQGLGYNRRALNLKRAAEMIEREYGGKFPKMPAHLEALPGVGKYTARAVYVFSENKPEFFVETNIRRVFLHFFFAGKNTVHDKEIFPFIESMLYHKNPRLWYWALMDYGALALKKIPNPNRKSRHYTRQPLFLGSHRYQRAKILSFILKKKKALMSEVLRHAKHDIHLPQKIGELKKILGELEREGFIKKVGKLWRA